MSKEKNKKNKNAFLNMGPMLKTIFLLPKAFKLVLNFPPIGPHKNMLGIFLEILSF